MTHTTRIWSQDAIRSSVPFPKTFILPICFSLFLTFLFHNQSNCQSLKTQVYLNNPTYRTLAPANDDCSGAQTVVPNGTCYPGTTVAANDSWVGTVGCQSGNNHPDVWYSFVATGSSLTVSVTAGTLTGGIEFVLVSSTSSCSGLSIVGSLCGSSPLTGTINGLQTGTTYYYTISSSTGSQGTFTTCVTNTSPVAAPGQDCSTAAILCNSNTFSQPTSNAGFGTQEVNTANSCWGSGGERQSKWFKFTASNSGTLQFNIKPNTLSDDYDWALWDITTQGCPSTSNIGQSTIACNWSGCSGSTGLSSCPASEPGANNSGPGCFGTYSAWGAPLTLTAGHTYALLVDNFTTSNSGFTLTFGGACNGGTAIIGPNATFTYTNPSCGVYNFTPTYPTSTSTYLWQFGDGFTSTSQNPSHTYATFGTFIVTLQVTDALGCVHTYSQTINIASSAPIITTQPSSATACLNGSATFTVVAAGGSVTYQWRKSGSPIPGADSSSYTINPVTAGSAGSYDVVVSNGCGSVTSITVTLSLPSALSAGGVSGSDTIRACVGYTVSSPLTVNNPAPSGGLPPYLYQWQLNGSPIAGATSTSYTPPTFTSAGTYVYTCIVKDSCATTATTAAKTFIISADPDVSITAPGPVCQNGTVILTATVTGGTGTLVYNWQSSPNGTTGWTTVASNSTTATTVTYSPPTSLSGITYYRVALNPNVASCNNDTSNVVAVTVNPLPTATISGNATVCQNAPSPVVTFTGANGTTPYTFTYTINGGSSQTVSTTSGNSVTLSVPTTTVGTFVYALVSVSDNNSCSQSQSGSVTITIKPKPAPIIITHN